MPMKRLFATVALIVLTTLPVSTSTASQASYCADIAAYIEMVDTRMADEMHALVTTPGWVEDAQRTEGLLQVAPDGEINPLVEYLAVPGVVLAGFDQAEIPERAMPLHESAAAYWATSSDMIQAMVKDGPSASYSFLQTLDTAAGENIAAQEEIVAACPEIPESYEESRIRLETMFAVLDSEDDPGLLADATPEDLEGMGFFFLFFGEEAVAVREPAQVSTPAIVTAPTPATVGTPED